MPSDFLTTLTGGPHLNRYAGDQEPTPPDARAFLLRKGLVGFCASLGKWNARNRFFRMAVTLSPELREKLWDSCEEFQGIGGDPDQTTFLDHINWLHGRGENDAVEALSERDVLQEMKGMQSSQLGNFMQRVEETHEQLSDLRNLFGDTSSVSPVHIPSLLGSGDIMYRPADQKKLQQYIQDGTT
jgi:hypothetical protein